MKYIVLFDVGGTGIKGSLSKSNNFSVIVRKNFPSHSNLGKDEIVQHFSNMIYALFKEASLSIEDEDFDVSMAFPGPFDYERGISYMKGLNKYDSIYGLSFKNLLKEKIKTQFNKRDVSLYFIHDVEAYALGVLDSYPLSNQRTFFLAIGTGAGSAFSIDGQIVKDREDIPDNGWCYYLPYKDSIIDDYISIRGIINIGKKYLGEAIDPLEIENMAKAGNLSAKKVYEEFSENLSEAIAPILEKFRASTIVLGGNISKGFQLFKHPFNELMNDKGINIIIEVDTSNMIFKGLYKVTKENGIG